MSAIGVVQFYDRTTFDQIPERKGIYAFFLNFEYIVRAYNNSPVNQVDVPALLAKTQRAHTLCKPGTLQINLYGTSTKFSSRLDLEGSHDIAYDPQATPPAADFFNVASALAKCTLLTPPIYIGITRKQTFLSRFRQHQKKYGHYKKKLNLGLVPHVDPLSKQGKFFQKLVHRKLEFRDLAYVCVPFNTAELGQIHYTESLLQAMSNPAMSTSH